MTVRFGLLPLLSNTPRDIRAQRTEGANGITDRRLL
jgi:hypothetical protein